MRRSSSIAKIPQSPRRVRFDFMGEEVLPTSSPQPFAFISARISSPEPLDDRIDCASNLATEPGEDEEEETLPRKVSSSDALRALSRVPLEEDGTVWTVVSCDSDDAAVDEASPPTGRNSVGKTERSETCAITTDLPTAAGSPPTARNAPSCNVSQSTHEVVASSISPEQDSSDDGFLAMARRKAPAPCVSRTPETPNLANLTQKIGGDERNNLNTGQLNGIKANTLKDTTTPTPKPVTLIQSEDELFHFEEEGLKFPFEASKRDEPVEQEQLEADDSDHDIATAPDAEPISLYATSPAVAIARPRERDAEESLPSRPKFQAGTVGSYKGKPLVMPVMRNPDILAKLESTEPVGPLTGSVHDRYPVEEDFKPSTLQTCISQGVVVSAPRSFSEMLILEDMMKSAKRQSTSPGAHPQ
ncbi:hypothetical protein UVI_02004030 [Ustilaginoidea virens]|nr:hypothetical protein UVI_02004030 [Ustilaginoidea virens]